MKLIDVFRRVLSEFDSLERVWLTSFNADIAFIETHLLPTVLDQPSPTTRMQYEELQQLLNEQGIDFRVFCDKRFVDTNQVKRTLIPVHELSPERGGSGWPTHLRDENSLFHAKVIYLEGKRDNSYHRVLGSGSANLTLSGWGRNREVFHFVEVDNRSLYRDVEAFFRPLFGNLGEPLPLHSRGVPKALQTETTFCHSFQETPFIHQLLQNKPVQELTVWSPYLSGDLASFYSHLAEQTASPELTLNLVPDRINGQNIRTGWTSAIQPLLDNNQLKFFNNPCKPDEKLHMTHAKLWATRDNLAIGSWNCTRPGANLRVDKDGKWQPGNNIEAGLIVSNQRSIMDYVGDALPASKYLFASPEQLDEEALEVPTPLPFDLVVRFDWINNRYEIEGVWHNPKSRPVAGASYTVVLPDLEGAVELHWQGKKLEKQWVSIVEPRKRLFEYQYLVYHEGERCASGFIVELYPVHRRSQAYDSLKDLMEAFATGGADAAQDDLPYRVSDTEEGELAVDAITVEEAEESALGTQTDRPPISYFRLFAASHHFAVALRNCRSIAELEHWVFIRPGCLEEWFGKAAQRTASSPPSIFDWFLVQEVSALGRLGLSQRRKLAGDQAKVPLARFESLRLTLPDVPEGADPRYVEYLQTEYQRISKSWGVE